MYEQFGDPTETLSPSQHGWVARRLQRANAQESSITRPRKNLFVKRKQLRSVRSSGNDANISARAPPTSGSSSPHLTSRQHTHNPRHLIAGSSVPQRTALAFVSYSLRARHYRSCVRCSSPLRAASSLELAGSSLHTRVCSLVLIHHCALTAVLSPLYTHHRALPPCTHRVAFTRTSGHRPFEPLHKSQQPHRLREASRLLDTMSTSWNA